MLLFSALLALYIHLNVSHPEVIIYSQLTSSCHATTTTTTTLILFPPTLNTSLFFFCSFFQCFSISGSIAVVAAAADTTINNVCRLQLHHLGTRNSEQWKFCFWRGAFGCASWCGRRRPSSTKVDLFRWQSTTNSFSRAFSMCRCKYAYVYVFV